jgi:hypothetical protein
MKPKTIFSLIVCLQLLLLGCATEPLLLTLDSPNGYLNGEWHGDAPDGTRISYTFKNDGSIIWSVEGDPVFKKLAPDGLKAKYIIKQNGELLLIDIFGFENKRFSKVVFRGIMRFNSNSSFQMEGGNPSRRPRHFSDEAINFVKSGNF